MVSGVLWAPQYSSLSESILKPGTENASTELFFHSLVFPKQFEFTMRCFNLRPVSNTGNRLGKNQHFSRLECRITTGSVLHPSMMQIHLSFPCLYKKNNCFISPRPSPSLLYMLYAFAWSFFKISNNCPELLLQRKRGLPIKTLFFLHVNPH